MPTNKQYQDMYEDEYYNDQNDYDDDEFRPPYAHNDVVHNPTQWDNDNSFRDWDELE